MRQVPAARSQTVAIELPEGHSAAQATTNTALKDLSANHQLTPSSERVPDSSNPFSSFYYQNNSSTDTVPDTDSIAEHVTQPSAFPPLKLIPARAHHQPCIIAPAWEEPSNLLSSQNELEELNAKTWTQDTFADSTNIGLNTLCSPMREPPLPFTQDSPNRRYLSSRVGNKSKTGAGLEDLFASSPIYRDSKPLTSSSPYGSVVSPRLCSPDASVAPLRNSSSSLGSSFLDSPPSLVHNSQSSLKHPPDSLASPVGLACPIKKRKSLHSPERPGLSYAKRPKHTPLKNLAVRLSTLVIPSFPEDPDLENRSIASSSMRVPLTSLAPPLNSTHLPVTQLDYPHDLELATARLQRTLSFREQPASVDLHGHFRESSYDDSISSAEPATSCEETPQPGITCILNSQIQYTTNLVDLGDISQSFKFVTPDPMDMHMANVTPKGCAEPTTHNHEESFTEMPSTPIRQSHSRALGSPTLSSQTLSSPTARSMFSPRRLLGGRKKKNVISNTTTTSCDDESPERRPASVSSLSPSKPRDEQVEGDVTRSPFRAKLAKLARLESIAGFGRHKRNP